MSESLRDVFPSIYAPLLPELFDAPAIAETRATCGDCAMCDKAAASGAPGDLDVAFFRPDIKCCSYHPTLPNYLVGAILGEDAPLDPSGGRDRVRRKIAGRVGVTPRWLAAPRKYLVLLAAARESSFGRSEALLCPYYDRADGTCSIWRHRESVCATFFCKHVAGATGHALWAAVRRYMEHVERTLARHAAEHVAPEAVEPALPRDVLTREDLEDRPPADAEYARVWGSWAGREEEFYVACAACVARLSRSEFADVVDRGVGPELLSEIEGRLRDVTQPRLADRLRVNPSMRVVPSEGGVGVTTYSRYDSLFLSQDLFDLLRLFDGAASVDDVIERIRIEHDVELPKTLLLELQVQGVVTAAS